jgi:hypothetical protein
MNSNRKYKTENKNRKEKEEKNITWPSSPHHSPTTGPTTPAQHSPTYPFVPKHLLGVVLILSVSWRAARRREALLPRAGSLPLLDGVTRIASGAI